MSILSPTWSVAGGLAVAALVAGFAGGWKVQSWREGSQQVKTITKTVYVERQSNDTTRKLDASATTAVLSNAARTADAADTVRTRGLFVHTVALSASACAAGASAPASTESRLTDADASAIQRIAASGDYAAVYAQVGHDYAVTLDKWRKAQASGGN